MSTLLKRLSRRTTDPAAIEALHDLFFIMERLDETAQQPSPDGMVKVTAAMWWDMISPRIRRVRTALDR